MLLHQNLAARVALRSGILLLIAFVPYLSAQTASPKQSKPAKSSCQLTQDDCTVYAALVEALRVPEHPEDAAKRNIVLIADTTAAPRDVRSHFGTWGYRSESKAAPAEETVVAFERQTQSSRPLNPKFGNGKSHRIITRGELDKVFKSSNWQDFYKEYPESGGYWISRVRATPLP